MSARGREIFQGLIRPAVDRQSEYAMSDLIEHLEKREWQSWLVADPKDTLVVGAMATRIVEYESGMRACIIVAASTRETKVAWESMRSVVARVEQFAKDQDCDVVRILGRPGWARVFKDFQQSYVCLDKTIGEMN